jgi:hypothetical protein
VNLRRYKLQRRITIAGGTITTITAIHKTPGVSFADPCPHKANELAAYGLPGKNKPNLAIR